MFLIAGFVGLGVQSIVVALTGFPVAAAVALLISPVPVIAWRVAFRSEIIMSADGIHVRNAWRDHDIPWAEFVDATPGYGGVIIEQRDGSRLVATAVQKSNLATWLGWRTRADDVVDALNSRRRAQDSHE